MAFPSRLVLVGALVVLTPALAGCNVKDWYNQLGDVRVFLQPVGSSNSSIGDFRELSIAIFGVSLKQVLVVDTKEFSYGAGGTVLDMVTSAAKNDRMEVATVKENLRQIESITVTLDVVKATDAQGKDVPVCREGSTSSATTCFFLDKTGVIRFADHPISINRGGTVEVTMPLQVLTQTASGKTEYFLNSDQSQAVIKNVT